MSLSRKVETSSHPRLSFDYNFDFDFFYFLISAPHLKFSFSSYQLKILSESYRAAISEKV